MKKWWLLYLRHPWDKRLLWSAAALALIPVAFRLLMGSEQRESKSPGEAADVATYIPKGFVLVPLEVQNYEALDSILGRFGWVDLYRGEAGGASKLHLVARNVRLLRAPLNPSHFAVLIEEGRSAQVMREGGPFTVIVKRPGSAGTEFVEEASQPRRTITYDGG